MLFKKYNEHIEQTEPLSRELIILVFDKSKQLNIGKFMWQTKNNINPETISELFKEKYRTYWEGDNWKFLVPNVKLEIAKRSIFLSRAKNM